MRFEILLVALCVAGVDSATMVLTSWVGTGTKVQYETVPVNTYDDKGKAVPNAALQHKSKGGADSYDCYDVQGQVKKNGEEYKRANGHFLFHCNNGIEEVKACIGSERSGKAVIKVGDTFNKDGFWHKCSTAKENHTVRYTEEPACQVQNKTYHVGDTMRSGFLQLKCEENGYKVVGCEYIGKNNEVIHMKPGTTAEVNGVMHTCSEVEGNLQYSSKRVGGCTKNGVTHNEGEKFQANHLNYECKDGISLIKGCYINESRNLDEGETVVEKNMVYRCFGSGGAVHYEEYACGFRGTPSCTPPPVPEEKEAGPVSSGTKFSGPGVASWSIVPSGGSSAQMPSINVKNTGPGGLQSWSVITQIDQSGNHKTEVNENVHIPTEFHAEIIQH